MSLGWNWRETTDTTLARGSRWRQRFVIRNWVMCSRSRSYATTSPVDVSAGPLQSNVLSYHSAAPSNNNRDWDQSAASWHGQAESKLRHASSSQGWRWSHCSYCPARSTSRRRTGFLVWTLFLGGSRLRKHVSGQIRRLDQARTECHWCRWQVRTVRVRRLELRLANICHIVQATPLAMCLRPVLPSCLHRQAQTNRLTVLARGHSARLPAFLVWSESWIDAT